MKVVHEVYKWPTLNKIGLVGLRIDNTKYYNIKFQASLQKYQYSQ